MSKKIFTDQEIELLKQNKYVKQVSSKGITYTDEMKQFSIAKSEEGLLSSEIFELAGFESKILGKDRPKQALSRWKKAYKKSGVMGLQDTRKGKSGRPLERELSLEEQLERERAKNKFLKVQLELQKKLDMIERGVYIHKSTKRKK
jgi:transposase